MKTKNFSATVHNFIRKSEMRTEMVMRESVQRTIDIAQTPTAKGGDMRVDTGFLRSSGQGSLTGMPTGPIRGDKTASYNFNQQAITMVIAGFKIGGRLFFGWTANYARFREMKDGFLRKASQRWQRTVSEVVSEARKRIK